MTGPETPPFDPAELSAYLDGELSAVRAAAIEARLAEDSALRAEYEALRGLDARARQAGTGALFVPAVQLPSAHPAGASLWRLAAIILPLLGLRLASRLVAPLGPSLLLNLLALALVAWAVVGMARMDRPEPGR